MVVHGYGQFLFGGFLADDVLIEVLLDFQRLRKLVGRVNRLIGAIVFFMIILAGFRSRVRAMITGVAEPQP